MKGKALYFILVLFLTLAGCGGIKPEAEIFSVEYVRSIPASGGIQYIFQDQDIVQIKLDCVFDPELAEGLDPSSDDYRSEIYAILIEGAHFFYDGQEVPLQYGYWPEKAGNNYVNALALFYLVPEDHSSDLIRFVYDGDLLGEGGIGIDTVLDPE